MPAPTHSCHRGGPVIPTASVQNPRKPWIVVALCCGLIAASVGLSMNAAGVFYTPVATDLGIGRGTFSLHMTIFNVATALAALAVPGLMRRFRYRQVLIPAVAVNVVATFLMGRMSAPMAFYVLGAIRGVSTCLFSMAPATMIVNAWFTKATGTATSIVLASSGLAGAIGSAALSPVVAAVGWRTGYTILAVLMLALCLPACLVPFEAKPEDEGAEPYGGVVRQAQAAAAGASAGKPAFSFANPLFLAVIGIAVMMSFVTNTSQHFPGYAESIGLAGTGALMTSAALIGNVSTKLLIGILADRVGAVAACVTMIVACLAGIAGLMFGGSAGVLIGAAVLFGACYSVAAVGMALLTRHFFAPELYDTVYPPVNAACNLGGAVSMSAVGYVYDFTQSYTVAFVLCAAMAGGSLALLLVNARRKA